MSQNRYQGPVKPVWISQNFLTGYKTIKRIINKTSISEVDHVIEIGPGKGHITGLLLKRCHKVSAVEIDERMYRHLLEKFSDAGNLRLYHQDFLLWPLPSGSYKVFANIPFCYTTRILRKLTESKNKPIEVWLTMEKGAAKRFLGNPRESLRSLMIKPLYDVEIVYHFRREDFHPMPGVDVVLLHLIRKERPDIKINQWHSFERFVTAGLRNNGAELRRIFTKKQLSKACREAGICRISPGELLYVQWLCLFRCYCNYVVRKY